MAVVGFVAVLAGLPSTPALAHPPGIQAATDYRVTVRGLEPMVDGVSVRFVADGSRLELRSVSAATVEVVGYEGEPMLRVSPQGAWRNTRAPSLYVDQPGGAARAGASAGAQPQWQPASERAVVRWQDHRSLWHGNPPPTVAADPGRVHRVMDWKVPIRIGTGEAKIIGFVEWVPRPSPSLWWSAVLVLAGALAAAGAAARSRPAAGRLVLAAVGPVVGVAAIWYQVLVVVDNAEPGAGALASALAARAAPLLLGLALVAGGVLVSVGRDLGSFLLAVGGPLTAFVAGLENVALLSHPVAPVAADPLFARLAEAVVLGGGAGLLAFVLTRSRRPVAAVQQPDAPSPVGNNSEGPDAA